MHSQRPVIHFMQIHDLMGKEWQGEKSGLRVKLY